MAPYPASQKISRLKAVIQTTWCSLAGDLTWPWLCCAMWTCSTTWTATRSQVEEAAHLLCLRRVRRNRCALYIEKHILFCVSGVLSSLQTYFGISDSTSGLLQTGISFRYPIKTKHLLSKTCIFAYKSVWDEECGVISGVKCVTVRPLPICIDTTCLLITCTLISEQQSVAVVEIWCD